MYLIQCVNAYTAVLAMAEKECDYKLSYALVMLKRKLQPHIDFFVSREMGLVKTYARKDDDGKIAMTERGKFVFEDPEKAEEYENQRRQLGMVEVLEEFKPVRVPVPSSISVIQLEALEGFLEFEGGDV
jgi:hypothetical protein